MVRPLSSLVLVLVLTVPAGAQGLLTRMRLATDDRSRPSGPASPAPDPNRLVITQHWYDGLSGSGSEPRAVLAAAALAVLGGTRPLWLPAVMFEEHFYSTGSFPGHPYALPDTGYIETGFVYGSNDDLDWFDAQRIKPWATRLALEEGHDFGTLNRTSGRFAFDTKWRVGMTADWDHYTERLPGGGTDETTLADINVTLRVAQTEWGQMHAGLGARGLFDSYRTRGGVNFQYGADLFPIDPVVVSTLLELGNLNDAFVLRLRAGVGVQLRHVELFGGYDWLRIGGVDLHGPMAGVRVWF